MSPPLPSWLFPRPRSPREQADALIAKGLRSEEQGDLQAAAAHFRSAAAAAPDYPTAHVNLGVVLEALGEADAAAAAYEAALALDPRHPYASYNLGKALLLRGDTERSAALLQAALEAKPDFVEAMVVLAGVLEARADAAGALQWLQSAVAQRPDYALALRNLGMLLWKLQRWAEAAETLRRAVAAEPGNADACYWLGNALVRLQHPGDAEAAYRAALERQPGLAEAWCSLGNVLADRGQRDEAGKCLERALQIRPDYADALVGMGNLYAATGRLEVAADCYHRALALEPGLADAEVNLGNVLKDQGLWREALQHYDAALALSPEAVEARWARALCHIPALRDARDDLATIRAGFAAELERLERWFEGERVARGWKAVGVAQPFWLAYQEADNRELLQRYGRLCARLMGSWQAQHAPPLPPGPRRAARPVRVGVVSQFFRDHSVWHAIVKGWFRHLDRERFALQAFCLDPYEDGETRYALARAARFERGHAGLRQWVAVIREAQPDVLIYPEIGMDPMSAKLASLRLAPRQAASWGHPETTGLPTIDAYLSAADLEPPGAQAHYTEQLVALPHLGCCVQPGSTEAGPPGLDREPGVPLLVCPGTPFKYAPEHDGVLAEIARRLGSRCRMVFFEYRTRALSAALRARLAAAFGQRGLDFERCAVFLPWQSRASFLGLLRAADVFLDTLGFSGFNTAQQAVECGLPIVTREGRFLRGRLASGILKRIGVPELVAADESQYVELAVRLAQDAGYRKELGRRIAAGRPLLFEDAAPVRALEDFLAQGV